MICKSSRFVLQSGTVDTFYRNMFVFSADKSADTSTHTHANPQTHKKTANWRNVPENVDASEFKVRMFSKHEEFRC